MDIIRIKWISLKELEYCSLAGYCLKILALVFVTLFYFASHPASASDKTPPLNLVTAEKLIIGSNIQYFEDAESVFNFSDVYQSDLHWEVNSEKTFNQGYSYSSWWVRFTLENTHPNKKWLLEISYAVLDLVEVNVAYEDGRVSRFELGDSLPFSSRPIPHRNFLVPIELDTEEKATFYIRLKTSSSSQLPLTLWSEALFKEHDRKNTLAEGMWTGGLLTIAIYNILMFMALRSWGQLFYIANVLSALLFMACLKGWSYQYLWPQATLWNDKSALIFLNLILLSSWLFTTSFLNVYAFSRTFELIQKTGLAFVILLIPFVYYSEYSIAIRTIIPIAVVACFWGVVCGITAWKKGNQSARYYLLAWSLFLIGGIVMALNKYHIVPQNVFTDFSFQIGSLFEILLFSLALADQINRERALRLKAEQDALIAQKKTNETLERHVQERTKELEIANEKLLSLSNTDQLLGIYNRRYLEKSLDAIYLESIERQANMAILLIDVDHFKAINDTYGHLIGDECLKAVTNRIANHIRLPNDILSRYGGEEFCVILPKTSIEDAVKIGERIRMGIASTVITTSAGPIDVSVSIGISASIPKRDCKPVFYMELADTALYKAKTSGRNRVITSAQVSL